MQNKILIITRALPPIGGGGMQRIVKFNLYLEQLGWEVTVCTTDFKNACWIDETRYKELNNIKIIRIKEKKINMLI